MSEETELNFETRMVEIQEEANILDGEFRTNAKRNSEIQKKLLELTGAYQELGKLLPKKEEVKEAVEEPKEVLAKKAK